MNNPYSINSETVQPVSVRRHRVAWEADDLAEETARRILSQHQKLRRGCWYLSPRFTVSSPAPTAEFFRRVIELRSSWLRTCRQVLGNHGQRRLARQVEGQARQGAILLINAVAVEEDFSDRSHQSDPLSDLPNDQRGEVIEAGQIAKGLCFDGILFIDGNPVPPRTWQATAEELLKPGAEARGTITRRKIDLAALKRTGDPNPLKAVTLTELRIHLAANPDAALYVAPSVTAVAPAASHAFLMEARKRSDEWHGKLYHALRQDKKHLLRAADLPTLMLAYCGTLVINGQCFIPGCWPNENPTKARLKRTPFQAPTVPPSFLGLDPSRHPGSELRRFCEQGLSVGPRPATPDDMNEMFKTLLATDRPGPS